MRKHYCWKCQVNEIPKPEYCCTGINCTCVGKPIDPPYCDECWEEMLNKVNIEED